MKLSAIALMVVLLWTIPASASESAFGSCLQNATTLCLNGGRFSVTLQWQTQDTSGAGQAVPITADTGYFWFFDRRNVEVVVKVLDACAFNDQFWVFAAGLTDVGVDMTVTEMATGRQKIYRNPRGTPFRPVQDTSAFLCSGGSNLEAHLATEPKIDEVSSALLLNNRFKVEATWKTSDASGVGRAVPLTSDTGYFWFFGESNVEVVVKILNACGYNDRFWVFAGGLTDVEVAMKVTDTVLGTTRTYSNARGTAFQPIQDSNAFSTCLQQPAFAIVTSAEDPLLLRATSPKNDRVEYFGEKTANGNPTKVTAVEVALANGDSVSIALDAQNRPVQALSSQGVPIDIRWLSAQSIVFTATTPDGTEQVSVTVDLSRGTSFPETQRSTGTPLMRIRSADRARPLSIPNFATLKLEPLRSAVALATTDSRISVRRCLAPVNDALVRLRVVPQTGLPYTLHGARVGDGEYRVAIPSSPSSNVQRAKEICENVAGTLDNVCLAIEGLGPAGITLVCPALAAAVSPFLTPAAGAAVFKACETFFVGAEVYCTTLGNAPGPGAPSLLEGLCGQIPLLDRYTSVNLTLTPSATIPGIGTFSESAVTAPGHGPFPNFTIATGGEVRIGRFVATPPDPAPRQDYVVAVEIVCAPPSTVVDMSIIGTDDYFDSTVCVVTGDGACSLAVPGAEAGVVDTITVRVLDGPSRQIVLVF